VFRGSRFSGFPAERSVSNLSPASQASWIAGRGGGVAVVVLRWWCCGGGVAVLRCGTSLRYFVAVLRCGTSLRYFVAVQRALVRIGSEEHRFQAGEQKEAVRLRLSSGLPLGSR
jgi:hypothetical protein